MSVLLLGACLFPGALAGQQSGNTPGFCLRGRPLPRCQWYPLAEVALSTRLADQNRNQTPARFYISGELGALYNLSARSALGGGAYLGADDDGWRLGIRPRYRHWIADGWTADAALGVLFAGELDLYEGTWPGLTAQVGVGWQDLVALTTQLEIIGTTQGTWVNWYAGLQAASFAALIIAPVTWLIAMFTAASNTS